MRRFFVRDITKDSKHATISGEEFSHLKKVLRLTAGNRVELFDGSGLELTGTIEEIEKGSAKVRIEGHSEGKKESPVDIVLLQGMVKGEKPDLIVQKATEIGVKGVVFYSTLRTVAVIREEKAETKLARLRKVAIEAAKQCGRTALPHLSYAAFKEAMEGHDNKLKVILWEAKGSGGLRDALRRPEAKDGVVLLVGPEGGFSEDEVAEAEKKGFIPVGLGPRILRAETAAIGALSIVQYELGDMN